MSGLKLALANNAYYAGLGVDITLLNKKGKNAWGSALSALEQVSKGLPIPANPLTQSASYLLDLANKAVDQDLADQPSNDQVKSATLAMNFAPSANCAQGFESTGTIAIVLSDGIAAGILFRLVRLTTIAGRQI